MKYTTQLGQELTELGFTFDYNHTDSEINYDVYKGHHIEVTLDHTNKECLFNMIVDDEQLDIKSMHQLIIFHATMKSILPTK